MPYTIVRDGQRYCVQNTDTQHIEGCHATQGEAQGHMRALYAAHQKAAPTLSTFRVGTDEYMFIITSNGYRDREGEYVTVGALTEYVNAQWQGDEFTGSNALLFAHRGIPIGKIIWADMHGPFLLEVAQKRQSGVPRWQAYIEDIWGQVKGNPTGWGASHGFRYEPSDKEDGQYKKIQKFETSLLRRDFAANPYTYAMILS